MDKKTLITTIIGAVFNIAIIVVNALGFKAVAETLTLISPEVNILIIAVLTLFGVLAKRKAM